MEIKTLELTGTALDYAVAVCEKEFMNCPVFWPDDGSVLMASGSGCMVYSPSKSWLQGGPIIEREKIQISPYGNGAYATYLGSNACYYGDTYLQAAMRCYVASKLGDVVEIPDELV